MRSLLFARTILAGLLGCILAVFAAAKPVAFDIPAQPLGDALLAFSQQAAVEALFSADAVRDIRSTTVLGTYEPANALDLLLRDTGFTARRRNRGQFVIAALSATTGAVQGRLVGPDGAPLAGLEVELPSAQATTMTDATGRFLLRDIPPGTHRLTARGANLRPLQMSGLLVAAGRTLTLETQTLQPSAETITQLAPFVVTAQSERLGPIARGAALLSPRTAAGNLDLPRSENGVLAYRIYNRELIERSGVVNLNTFLQRELLESDAATRPPEQDGSQSAFTTASTNLNLRSFGTDSTVVLLNGRRLPESPPTPGSSALGAPDLNFIPLSLVQQVEVLPVSASALYSGNAVGGVVNIVLRPDLDTTEISTTYTNALGGCSAPQSTLSLQHGRTLLAGKLRLRLNANFSRTDPPTKADLGLDRPLATGAADSDPLYGATPNVRSADGSPLFGPGTASVTSVAPGADGTGGLAAFADRAGRRSSDLFAPPDAGLVASPLSALYPFGRREKRAAVLAAATYDVLPSLQLGLDLIHSGTVVNRGHDLFTADLALAAASPQNPFGRDVFVSVADFAPALGRDYSEARLDFNAVVLAALLRLPGEWRLTADGQYTNSVTKFRGVVGADTVRWQSLVDRGLYQPLRDTQRFSPPESFYDEVIVYRGSRGRFAKLADYETLDGALRLTNQGLRLPTGLSTIVLGADFRRNTLASHTDTATYGDGTAAEAPVAWTGRTLDRYSFFGELQAPLLPARWLPRWIRGVETDLGARYVAADTAAEANLAPAGGVRIDFARGFALRGSVATSNRFPTPYMGRRADAPDDPTPGGGPIEYPTVRDPQRGESYTVPVREAPNAALRAESTVTRTFGAVAETGEVHHFRASLDWVATEKTNEQIFLEAQTAADLESYWPARITRDPLTPGDSHTVGRIAGITTGVVNVSWRRSENLNLTLDYAWNRCGGGTLELFVRWIGYQRYERRVLPNTAVVDELNEPDGTASGLLRDRATFGASWSNRTVAYGFEGRYFGPRTLPLAERPAQGSARVSPFWQFDTYVQCELARLFPRLLGEKRGLRAQLRIDNLFNSGFPRYAADPSGAGIQCYGDWRGRTYSLSLTATF